MAERRFIVIEEQAAAPAGEFKVAGASRRGLEDFGRAATSGLGKAERAPKTVKLRTETMTKKQAADVRADPKVKLVLEPMPIALIEPKPAAAQTGDGDAWGLEACAVDASPRDGAGVTVAVIDTGIDLDHPAFAAIKNRIEAKDFTKSPSGAADQHGHGTHCAGTIFGQDVGGRRIGIARGIDKALIAKVFADDGDSDTAFLFDAMMWAQRSGANVISMSLGFDFSGMVGRLKEEYDLPDNIAASQALVSFATNLRAFDTLVAAMDAQAAFGGGSLIVAASGNESERDLDPDHVVSASLPSSARGVIPVGAYGADDKAYKVADFSNIDPQIVAPGVDILSAEAGTKGLTTMSGTSMACPHIAGLAALWWQDVNEEAGNPTPAKVIEQMFVAATRNKLPTPYNEADFGRGRALAPV